MDMLEQGFNHDNIELEEIGKLEAQQFFANNLSGKKKTTILDR